MCRLAAYLGPEIPLERIIIRPAHSLLEQSQAATESKLSVNGDGFGIAFYSDDTTVGLYKEILPALSDENLASLCKMVRSRLFLAHVRASTVGEISRQNCHPFSYKNWSFVHNGEIGGFNKIRRTLEAYLSDDLFEARRGTTDSELFFLLTIQNGLMDAPAEAIQKTLDLIQSVQVQVFGGTLKRPNRFACVLSDGESLFGFRFSSDQKSPTLYMSKDTLTSGGRALASEPLDGVASNWQKVSEGDFVQIGQNENQIVELM